MILAISGDGDSAVWAVTEYAYDAVGRKIARREGSSAQPLDNSPESLYSEAEGDRLTVCNYSLPPPWAVRQE